MSSDFEWRFGDELPEEASDERRPHPILRRRWLIWGLALLLVGGGTYAWWRRRQHKLGEIENQVQQVARLELRALTRGDTELFLSLQDDTDQAWGEAQAANAEIASLALPLQGLTGTRTSVGSARVIGDAARTDIEHTAALSSGRTATFRAVRFYRLTRRGRWIHTKADPAYRGDLVTLVGDRLELRVWERDTDWLELMAIGLTTLVFDFCELTSCGSNPLILDLTGALDEAAVPEGTILPAPFLVGAPADEAAQAMWEASLQALLLDRLITRESGRPTGVYGSRLLQDRFHAWFRAELGLDGRLSPDLELIEGALESGTWIPLRQLWTLPSGEARQRLAEAEIDLFLSFIQHEYGTSAVARLPRAFGDATDPGEAIASVVGDPWSVVRRHYLAYVSEVTAERIDELVAFPSYDLLLGCRTSLASTELMTFGGLQLGQSEITRLSAGSEVTDLSLVSWSPDGERLLAVRSGGPGTEFHLLQPGGSAPEMLPGMPADAEPVVSMPLGATGGWSPDSAHLAYRLPHQAATGIVDLGSGEHVRFEGDFVAWSPDGSRLIYGRPVPWHWAPDVAVYDFRMLDLESGRARRLEQGYAATWSPDGTEIAYVTSRPAVVVSSTMSGEIMTLLGMRSLRQTLDFTPTLSPSTGRPFQIDWSSSGEWIAVGATRMTEDGLNEGLTMLVRDGTHRVLGKQAGGILDLYWSSDGRWLTTTTFWGGQTKSVVRDLDGDILFEGAGALVSWSSVGDYLAVVQWKTLRVLEIESGTWDVFEVPGICGPAMWNPRAPVGELPRDRFDRMP